VYVIKNQKKDYLDKNVLFHVILEKLVYPINLHHLHQKEKLTTKESYEKIT